PDWDAVANVSPHRRFPVRTLRRLGPRSPDHAPAGFRSTATLKQALEIIPAGRVDFVKGDGEHAADDSDASHSAQWRAQAFPVAELRYPARLYCGAPKARRTKKA